MRARLTELGVPCPRWAQVDGRGRADGLRRRGRLAGRGQDPARRLRRQGRPRRRVRGRGRGLAGRRGSARGRRSGRSPTACSPRSGSTSAASSRCWSPAAPPGRPPRGRSSRPCRPTASAPRSSRRRRASTPDCAAAAHRGRRCGSPGSSASPACWRSSCSRCATADAAHPAYSSTSWPCARTTAATGSIDGAVTSQFEQHLRAVLDLPLGDPPAARAVDGDGQRARRRLRRALPGLPARAGARPGLKVHLYGKERAARPQDRPRQRQRRRPGRPARRVPGTPRTTSQGVIDRVSSDAPWSASSWAATPTGRSWRRPRMALERVRRRLRGRRRLGAPDAARR